jgi:ABC-type hemin transport system, periplasmic component
MKLKILCATLLALVLFTAAACAAYPLTITDFDGNSVTITEQPQKIISLTPATTEIIFALGAGERLVGDTDYCNYPEEAKAVTKIGGYSTISIEKSLH